MEGKTFKEVYLCQQKAISHDGQISRASPITSLHAIDKECNKKVGKIPQLSLLSPPEKYDVRLLLLLERKHPFLWS